MRGKPKWVFPSDVEDLFRIADVFKQVPDIRFASINGADHMPTLTHPNEMFRLITQFLSE
jgi:pimeloyl-ACP methyl ester carboxylesterase